MNVFVISQPKFNFNQHHSQNVLLIIKTSFNTIITIILPLKMQEAGFEPAPPKRIVPETIALDHSATLAYTDNTLWEHRSWCDTKWNEWRLVHTKKET